jgi:hypothetical protein
MTDRKDAKGAAQDEGLAYRSVNSSRRPTESGSPPRPSPATGSSDPTKVPDQQIPKDR